MDEAANKVIRASRQEPMNHGHQHYSEQSLPNHRMIII